MQLPEERKVGRGKLDAQQPACLVFYEAVQAVSGDRSHRVPTVQTAAAPVLGADTASVLGELGLEEGVMRELVAVAARTRMPQLEHTRKKMP